MLTPEQPQHSCERATRECQSTPPSSPPGTLCQPQLLSRRRKSGKESLRSRFNKYAVAGRPLGPEREPDKMALFVELQRRGFGLMYRFVGSGEGEGGGRCCCDAVRTREDAAVQGPCV